ncbi:hypothetical protein ABZT03_38380 [Streptomyces sp. NPDC005574]|uniref:hypothetical protein n=1 Tax=Streptomyces sp. NPDC005574 TaxID=3156891 RepID=UPI0033BB6D67
MPASSTGATATHTSSAPTTSAAPTGSRPSTSPPASSAPTGGCVAGHVEITVHPGDAVERRLCARPGTVVSLVLRPREDDRRWTDVRSSAPAFVLAYGWRTDPDGTAHAVLRCAGGRGGAAAVTVRAKAPDVAGAARAGFTLHVSVVPYAREG